MILLLFACGNNDESSSDFNVDIEKKHEGQNSDYSYIQSKDSEKAKEILIVVIDPHGEGEKAINYFKKVSEYVNCTVIGLNNVENNQQDFMKKIQSNIDAAIVDLKLDSVEIYLAGFSGGAMMAFEYGKANDVAGVLMCGLVGDMLNFAQKNFPLVLTIGNLDFNFIYTYNPPNENEFLIPDFANYVFEGKHKWPSEEVILNSMSYLFVKNNVDLKYEYDYDKKYQDYLRKKKYYLAYRVLDFANSLKASDEIQKKIKVLTEKSDYKENIGKYEQMLIMESDRNNFYYESLMTKNQEWWKNELYEIEKYSGESDYLKSNSYKRTKAFLGIIIFMTINNEIQNTESQQIDKFLFIYELLEPENPDCWFFKSVRAKQISDTLYNNYLNKAFEYGYKDTAKAISFGLM